MLGNGGFCDFLHFGCREHVLRLVSDPDVHDGNHSQCSNERMCPETHLSGGESCDDGVTFDAQRKRRRKEGGKRRGFFLSRFERKCFALGGGAMPTAHGHACLPAHAHVTIACRGIDSRRRDTRLVAHLFLQEVRMASYLSYPEDGMIASELPGYIQCHAYLHIENLYVL